MNEGATTWALVVGIDEYDNQKLRRLTGAVADAVAAVKWLRRVNVPDSQILLHAVPSATSKLAVDALGLPYQATAKEDKIWESIAHLEQVTDGTRLFVFLSGHGLYEPGGHRLFLTQEAGVNAWTNLGIERYVQKFRSLRFRRQFLIVDACQNYPYDENLRPTIEPRFYGNPGFVVNEANSMAICYSAGQDQFAIEIDGRGALSRRLFEALDLDCPYGNAVCLDFVTGERTIAINKVMRDSVIEQVRMEASQQQPPANQVPAFESLGPAARGDDFPIVRLPDVGTSSIEVAVDPPHVAADIKRLRIWVEDAEHFWSRELPKPPGFPVVPPSFVNCVPKGTSGTAVCHLHDGRLWQPAKTEAKFETDSDGVVFFKFTPPLAGGLAVHIGIDLTDATGAVASHMYAPEYAAISEAFNFDSIVQWGSEVARGVRIFPHESGPHFEVEYDFLTAGLEVVGAWSNAVRRLVPSEVRVSTLLPWGATPEEAMNLALVLPQNGARGLAGALADVPVVSVRPIGESEPELPWETLGDDASLRQYGDLSLRQLEDHPVLRRDPGPHQIRLSLPWGSWSRQVLVPLAGRTTVHLPESVGNPPLRVRLHRVTDLRPSRVFGVAGRIPSGRVRAGLFARNSTPLKLQAGDEAAWELEVPASAYIGLGTPIVELGAKSRAAFPLHPYGALAVQWSNRTLRVEPLSSLAVPAWDLLVASGRLDALSPESAEWLTFQKWSDPIMGLAGAYAVNAARGKPNLAVVAGNLARLIPDSLDVALLQIAVDEGQEGPLAAGAVERLRLHAIRGAVPLLRWGMPLALNLLERCPNDEDLGAWFRELALVNRRLSPISVWTAWSK